MKLPRLRVLVLAAMIVASLSTLGWWVFGPPGVAVELTRRGWRMEIVVERLRAEPGSDWCDDLPADAHGVTRRRVENAASQPAAARERCSYTQLAWRRSWIVKTEGGPQDRPEWPRPPLRMAAPGEAGSERLGRREAFYEIELSDGGDHLWTCQVSLARWQQLRVGQRFRIPVDRFGTADCPRLVESRL